MKKNSGAWKLICWISGIIIYIFVFLIVAKIYVFSNPDIELRMPSKTVCNITDKQILINVKFKNKTSYNLNSEAKYYLSYHLLDSNGNIIKFDNVRTNLPTVQPGRSKDIGMKVEVPRTPGEYKLEVDLVKEKQFWFKNRGNKTVIITLVVEGEKNVQH
ncbi:MAG: hypothetical protein ACM3UU_02300 [Ignavibacteriales bacterium]